MSPTPLSASPAPPAPPGLAARRIAADIVGGVLRRRRPLDEQLETSGLGALPERDRALVRALVATVLRRLGTLRHLLAAHLERGLPREAPQVEAALLVGAAQILFFEVPDHAAVDLSVRLTQADRHAARYSGLVNAVLRRLTQGRRSPPRHARRRDARYAGLADAALDRPLRRYHRPRHCRGARAGAGARSDGQERSAGLGRTSRRPRAADRVGAHHPVRPGVAACRLRRRRMVGAGRRGGIAGSAAWRRPGQDSSPNYAPRPAAKPRSSALPARR